MTSSHTFEGGGDCQRRLRRFDPYTDEVRRFRSRARRQVNAPQSASPHAAEMLGQVARSTAEGEDSGTKFCVGEDIFGPFEAGFGDQQNNILERLGCSNGALGHVRSGLDTMTAEAMIAYQCNIDLPRTENGNYISLLDECGGHTPEYHFHERLACLYNSTAPGHSTKVGESTGGTSIYGKWESFDQNTQQGQLPLLDACGGHKGPVPDESVDTYHHHVQEKPPFIIGCEGPNDDAGKTLVTVEQCRAFYSGCGDGDEEVITTKAGDVTYDYWCPCFDANGNNFGPIAPLPVFQTPATPAPTPPPASTVVTRPVNVVLFMPDDLPVNKCATDVFLFPLTTTCTGLRVVAMLCRAVQCVSMLRCAHNL